MLAESNEEALVRHLTLFDLVVIGVAGTVGSGIFAIVGLIGHDCEFPFVHVTYTRRTDISSTDQIDHLHTREIFYRSDR